VPGTIAWKKPQARSAPGKTNVTRTQKAIDRVYNSPLSSKVKSEKLELLLGLSQKIHPNELWFAYNTAYVLHNGEIIHKYSKKNDFTEVNANESNGGRIVFIPGDRSPYFTVDGVDFALEICG